MTTPIVPQDDRTEAERAYDALKDGTVYRKRSGEDDDAIMTPGEQAAWADGWAAGREAAFDELLILANRARLWALGKSDYIQGFEAGRRSRA